MRLTEDDAIEAGVRCPDCGSYTAFDDIVATGRCRSAWRSDGDDCTAGLALDLVVTDL